MTEELRTSVPRKTVRSVKRRKKYVSPFRQTDEQRRGPRNEVVCPDCKLPSHRGLPPFIAVNRMIDGEKVRILRHAFKCPSDAPAILAMIAQERKDMAEAFDRTRKHNGKVVSYHTDEDGNVQRKVVA